MTGFLRQIKQKEYATLQTVDDAKQLISKEVVVCKDFEQRLLIELRELRDLEANLSVISDQMETVRKLIRAREETLATLFAEQSKMRTEVDTHQCEQYLQIIYHLDGELRPMTHRIYQELEKLRLNDTHKLYRESGTNVDRMHAIDKEVRSIAAEILQINRRVDSNDSELNMIQTELNKLNLERSNRNVPAHRIGF